MICVPKSIFAQTSLLSPGIDKDSAQLLRDLVAINSGTASIEGQERMRQRLIPEFENLGFRTTIINGINGRKVLSFRKSDQPRVMFLGHVDTVFPDKNPSPELKITEKEIRGPGVIDMKGGIVLMVHLLKNLKSKNTGKALNDIIVVLNDDEETGSSGSKEILKSLAVNVESILIFEPGLPDGSLVASHPGLDWIRMTVKGKAAHAGLEPEKGLNACVELAAKILEIQKLNRYHARLSVSPDVIQGGTTPNTICEEASVRIDARYPSVKDRNQVRKKLELIKNHVFTATKERASEFTSTISYDVSTDPMPPELTKELNEKAFSIAKSLGITLTAKPVGYLSDGNQIAALKKKLIVGVGPHGGGMHTDNEVLIPSSFAERSRWLTLLLESLLVR